VVVAVSAVSIQQIEIFLAVASSKSISAAARELYISQSVVSESIRDMEILLGFSLFLRNNRGVALTEQGIRIYAEMDPVYKRFRIAADKILDGKTGRSPNELNIGAFHDLSTIHCMMSGVAAFSAQFPKLLLRTEYYNHNELREKLLCEELDVSFTFSFEVVGRPDIDCCRLSPLEQFFIVPAEYNMKESDCDFGVLRDKTLILETFSGRDVMLDICHAHGFLPKRIKYVNSYLLLTHLIASGEGFTVAGQNLPGKDYFKSRIIAIPVSARDCNEYVHIVAAWRRGDERASLRDFVRVLENKKTFSEALAGNDNAVGSKWYN
jgi:DNA-binding transcriptional LysR family regulator